jgi:hypothetical protein
MGTRKFRFHFKHLNYVQEMGTFFLLDKIGNIFVLENNQLSRIL